MTTKSRVWHAILSAMLTTTFLMVVALPVGADYDAAKRAWDAGRPAEALAQWRAAADAGDRRAMLELGRVYGMGLGAPQDYVLAHMWFNLAASRGEMAALKERDALAAKMTSAERAEAQKRAREWRPGGGPKAASAGQPATAPPQPSAGPPPARVIREAQGLLATLGYQPGPADGQWGGRTAKAYAAFLRDAGLPSSDVLTPEGIRALRAVAKRQRGEAEKQSAQPAQPRRPVALAPRPGALHRAANAGDVDGLNAALKAGVNVNARDGRGWTVLMHAANKGYVLLVAPLLKAGADPDLRAPDGATALFMAAVHGHSEVIDLLMKAGAEVSIKGPKGKTPVDAARARYGDAEAARKKNKSPAVIALLEGKMWAQVAEEVRRYAEQALVLKKRVEDLEQRNWPALESFRDCRECPEMVIIPAGTFTMGSPANEKGRYDTEGLQREVQIKGRFAVGKYEITRHEYGMFVKETDYDTAGGCYVWVGGEWKQEKARSWQDPGYGQTAREPVVCVSWKDAKAYAVWLSGKTGREYRLLSESEWEYVARGGTETRRYWGEDSSDTGLCRHANGAGSETSFEWRNKACGDGYRRTASAGSLDPNGWGLYDTIGNVWEWVEDCWHKSYSGAPEDANAWTMGGDCGSRVLRGGSWVDRPGLLRSAIRGRISAGNRYDDDGFRIARTLTP